MKCDGDNVLDCIGGKEARYDCVMGYSDSTCVRVFADTSLCMLGDECLFPLADEECREGVITFCMLGKEMVLDCKKFGYSGCGASTVNATPSAHCVL
jgi:hypothetical protein